MDETKVARMLHRERLRRAEQARLAWRAVNHLSARETDLPTGKTSRKLWRRTRQAAY